MPSVSMNGFESSRFDDFKISWIYGPKKISNYKKDVGGRDSR